MRSRHPCDRDGKLAGALTRPCEVVRLRCSAAVVGLSRAATSAGVQWVCTSVAMAFASSCGRKTNRRIGRLLGGERWAIAGGGLRLRGAPRPGRPALPAQGSADRPARRPHRCTRSSGRRRTRMRSPSARRTLACSSWWPRAPSGPSSARAPSRSGPNSAYSLCPSDHHVVTASPQA